MSAVATAMPAQIMYDRPAASLQPPDQYREMALAVIRNSPDLRDFLARCEACGLPSQDRLDTINAQCEFCTAYLKNFHPDTV